VRLWGLGSSEDPHSRVVSDDLLDVYIGQTRNNSATSTVDITDYTKRIGNDGG
jgi:hypothetical protein